jgi:prevent-host-death family protein
VVTVPERIGIRELRDHLTAVIRRVRNGETLEVTHDGRPVALLSPIPADRLERLERAGLLTPARPLRIPPRRFRSKSGLTSEQIIADDRGE